MLGVGAFLFNFIGTTIANPENKAPHKIGDRSYFDKEIADQMPNMFFVITGVCVLIMILSVILIKDEEAAEEAAPEKIGLGEACRTREFWIICIGFTITTVAPVYVVEKFKDIALHLDTMDDQSLTFLGSLGAMFASSCKLVFGAMTDKYGFKINYIVIIGMVLFVGIGINFWVTNAVLYSTYVCISFASLGAHYTINAPVCRLMFGTKTGMKIWGFVYTTIGIGTGIALVITILQDSIADYAFVITLVSAIGIFPLLSLIFLREKPLYEVSYTEDGQDLTPLLKRIDHYH